MYPTRTTGALALALGLVACSDAPTTALPEANTSLTPVAATANRGGEHDRDRVPAPSTALVNSPLTDAAGRVVGSFTGRVRLASVSTEGQSLLGSVVLEGTAVVNGERTRVKKVVGTTTLFAGGGAAPTASAGGIQQADIGIQQITLACPILSLVTGQIHLNLLGLDLVLAPLTLNLVAIAGPGALLGNLLCVVVHLLDGPIIIGTALATLIGIINGLLAGLGL